MKSFDDRWEVIHKERLWGTFPSEHLVRFVRRTFLTGHRLCAVDIGCGCGAQSGFLRDEGFAVIAIDGSQAAIDTCLKRFWPAYPIAGLMPIGFSVADATEIPLQENSEDLAVDVCALQHITAEFIHVALAEALRVLKPGGWFFSITAAWNSTVPDDPPLRRLTRSAVRALYEHAGFAIRSIDSDEHTERNGILMVSNWIVIAQKP